MSFDFLASHYRWMEAVLAGGVMQRARTRWHGVLKGRRNVLIVGEGPGRCVEVLRGSYPGASITVVEASAGMISVAKARLRKKRIGPDGITWVQADVRVWAAEERGRRYDVVITPFVLDCFRAEDVALVVSLLSEHVLTRDCHWLLSDFCEPDKGWRRMRGRLVHALMYRFFRTVTRLEARRLTPPDAMLRSAGFELEARELFNAGLIHSDCWRRL